MGNKVPWSKSELELLVNEYSDYGSMCPSFVEERSPNAIGLQARRHNMSRLSAIRWSEEDIGILRREYPSKGADIPELLLRYSKNAIKLKANTLGLRCVKYRVNITLEGVTYTTVKQVSDAYSIPYATIMSRLRSGKTMEEAVSAERMYGPQSAHGEPVVYDGVVFPSITAACRAASIASTTVTAVRREHPELTAQEAFDKAVQKVQASPKSIARLYGLVPCSLAYVDCDGISHFFVYCSKCNVALLMTAAQCSHHTHGDNCKQFAIPKGAAVSYEFSRAVKKKWGVQLPYPIYNS